MTQPNSFPAIPTGREVLGIVGGFGPWAHIHLETRLLQAAQRRVGACRDQDFPAWILVSPTETPDRVRYILGEGPDVVHLVADAFKRLETLTDADGRPLKGADFAVIPCITAHALLPAIRERVSIEIMDMVAETARHLKRIGESGPVGVLATSATTRTGLFQAALTEVGISCVIPESIADGGAEVQRDLVMGAIYGDMRVAGAPRGGLKGEGPRPEHVRKLEDAARFLVEKAGVKAIIAGCTELDLALPGGRILDLPVISPYDITIDAILRRVYRLPDPV